MPAEKLGRSVVPTAILERIVVAAMAISALWVASTPLRGHVNWMYLVMDDCFYYLKIAQNFAGGAGSTFNGLVPTNGYHPLWMLCMAGWIRCFGAGSIAVFLSLSVFCSTLATFYFSFRLVRNGGLERLSALLVGAYVAVYAIHVVIEGMEVALTIPLMLAFLCVMQSVDWWSATGTRGLLRGACVGLLASLMILSRLDAALFACLLFCCYLCFGQIRHRMTASSLAGAAAGLLPLLGYVVSNKVFFDVWEPVSGMSKQLRIEGGVTSKAAHSLLGKSTVQLVTVLIIVLALVLLPLVWKRMTPIYRAICLTTLLFPFVYTAVLSLTSDWILWPWYFYSLRPAICVSLFVFLQFAAAQRLVRLPAMQAGAVLIILGLMAVTRWTLGQPEIVDTAKDLRTFSLTHPGVYAMGDRAGAAGYLLDQPVVQTEGLTMDKAYLELLRQQAPLREALGRYHVRYYVASTAPYTGCFQAAEPAQAGSRAPHMRAEFCQISVAHWSHAGIETYVFDLNDR